MSDTDSEVVSNSYRVPSKKKKRSANFTTNETFLLMSLVSDLKHIIENKKTDMVSMQEKNIAWNKITSSFNSVCPESRHRTMESLKKLYDNKKREVRKEKAEEKKDILLTGGGPSQKINRDPTHDIILSIVDPLTVVGGPSYYGSDSLPLSNANEKNNDDYLAYEFENNLDQNINENVVESCTVINQEEEATVQNVGCTNMNKDTTKSDWKKGSDLMKPLATPLKRPLNRRRPKETVVRSLASSQLSEKYNQLADTKKVIAEYVLKKLKLEIEHSNDEHKVKMQVLQLDLEMKKQQFKAI